MNAAPAAPPSPLVRRRFWPRLLAAFVLLAVLLGALAAWLVASEAGLRTLAGAATHASGGALRFEGVRGALRGPLAFARLRLELPDAKVEADDVELAWRPAALWSRQVFVERLRAGRIAVFLKDATAPPATEAHAPPQSLRLPITFDLTAEVGALEVYAAADGEDVRAGTRLFAAHDGRFALGGEASRFLLRQLAAELPQGRVEVAGELGAEAPFAVRLEGRLEGGGWTLAVDAAGTLAAPVLRARAQGHGMRGEATARAAPFAALPLETVAVDIEHLDPAVFAPALPRADLRVRADFTVAAGEDGGPVLRGPLHVDNARPATLDAGGLPVTRLRAEVDAAMDAVRLAALVLEGGGGQITGELRWRGQAEHGADTEVETAAAPAFLPAAFGQVDARLDVAALDPARLDRRLPAHRVDGHLEVSATARRQQGKVLLRAGAARAAFEGEIMAAGVARAAFVAKLDLRDVDPALFHPASPAARINLQAAATGFLGAQAAAAVHFAFGDSRLDGRSLGGKGLLSLDTAHVYGIDLWLDLAGNRLKANGNWGNAEDRLALELDAPRLAAVGYGLQGRIRAAGTLAGGLDAPAGTLRLDAEKLRLPGAVEVAALTAQADVEAGDSGALALRLDGAGISAGGGRIARARFLADGRRDRHRIRIEIEEKSGTDAFRVEAALEGGLQALHWQGNIVALESGGKWPARLRAPAALVLGADELSLSGAAFTVGAQGEALLDETRWKDGETTLRGSLRGLAMNMIPGQGRRNLLTLAGDWDLRLGERIEGQARVLRESGDLTVRGEIATRLGLERLEAYLFAHDRRVRLVFAAHGREIGEVGASLEAGIERDGQGWRLARAVPLSGAAHLSMPSLAWLGRLMRENVETGGAILADVDISGTPDRPDLRGQVTGHALQLNFVDLGLMLTGGELEAEFAHRDGRQNLRLARLAFESSNRVKPNDKRVPFKELTSTPGRLLLTGEIALDGAAQGGRFALTAERLPLFQRHDRWLIVSGEGKARIRDKTLELDAALRADAGYIEVEASPAPSLGDDVVVRDNRAAGTGEGEDEAGAEDGHGGVSVIAGQIALDLGNALYLAAFGVDTRLMGKLELQLRPHEAPRALGTIRTVAGTYRGYGQRLAIERGAITFQGEPDNPGLNIVAMRRGMEVDAGVAITGNAHKPQVRLVSEPSVPDHEKLSWLVLGRAPDAAGGADLGLLMPAAQALFGGTGGGMSDDLARRLGIDSFSIGQGDLNSSSRSATSRVVGGGSRISSGPTVSSDVVSVGKRLTNDLFLSFEQNLSGAESLVKLTYRLGRRMSLVARGGTDNALDFYYMFFFRGKESASRPARQPSPGETPGEEGGGED
ncbi:MAG: translocation/assembly module TamB domain-containing protein [Azoarcus sp.]|jgi:translocation and assembly module TamB|nr:translocation/assembly module TamB domain-containing protein [Azoarcus sp.]